MSSMSSYCCLTLVHFQLDRLDPVVLDIAPVHQVLVLGPNDHLRDE